MSYASTTEEPLSSCVFIFQALGGVQDWLLNTRPEWLTVLIATLSNTFICCECMRPSGALGDNIQHFFYHWPVLFNASIPV